MRFAPEGYPFIVGSLFVTVLVTLILIWVWRSGTHQLVFFPLAFIACVSLIITLFMAFFFRDPERSIPAGEGLYVAPADGKVILIKDIYEDEYIKSDAKEISIFMSPLDVHVNRSPDDGRVNTVRHIPGKFMAAYKDDASLRNEHIDMVLEANYGKILVRQVAGFIARRAVCRVKTGDTVKRGERYGMIKFSSRLDVYLPKDVEIMVHHGDKVKAGETVIARNNSQ